MKPVPSPNPGLGVSGSGRSLQEKFAQVASETSENVLQAQEQLRASPHFGALSKHHEA